jgi:hypothetical protein
MKHSLPKSVVGLTCLAGLLGLFCALMGLFMSGGRGPFTFTSVAGREVLMYGKGLYQNDAAFSAPVFRGTDLVTVFVSVPLLAVVLVYASKGTLKGRVLLTSMLAAFLYNSASIALGVTYNLLFPVYIVYFSASLFAFLTAFRWIYPAALAARVNRSMPHGWLAGFLFFAGVALLFVWGMDLVAGAVEGRAPALVQSYHTLPTHVLDLGIITPTLFLSGVFLLRRRALGYPLASILLVNCALIGLVVAGQTAAQLMDGVNLTPLDILARLAPFLVMALVSGWLTRRLYQGIDE